ncbi:MAG TPA: allantoate amidohydrolase [Casimicrobiaceae bacterium]|nr:allantoate amidohydrolase [Casimicrobiaceae bacterium]
MRFGTELMRQADVLGLFTEDSPRVTRTYLSPQHKQAGEYLIGLMRRAGMSADFDALGNIVGRYEAADPGAPVVMTGSHQDSVRNAGKYDGLFGIITAIACVKDLHDRGRRLPYTLEIVGFGDEEGVRFGATLIGSKAIAGSFEPSWLDKADESGVTLRRAISDFGGDPDAWPTLSRRGKLAAYVESHIEQGPVLLNDGLPVGVVTAIAGASRMRVNVTGLAGHAGTVPMGSRQDALCAAAEMMLFVERYCEGHKGLVGTVGKVNVQPGAINVIPQDVEFTIDVRSGDDALRRQAVAAFQSQFEEIAKRRRVSVIAAPFYTADAAPCDAALQAQFAQAISAHGVAVHHLPSGAGHDAMVFPPICPMAMLFVRCGNNGISHHPDETMTAEDAEIATSVLLHFFEHFDAAAFAAGRART